MPCRICAFVDIANSTCQILKAAVNLDKDMCPHFAREVPTCDICGSVFLGKPILSCESDGSECLSICAKCDQAYGTCRTCRRAAQCIFETSPIALPKAIMQTFQQGNATIRQQVPNPTRIEATCKKDCSCWDEEYGCIRQSIGFCKKFEVNHAEGR